MKKNYLLTGCLVLFSLWAFSQGTPKLEKSVVLKMRSNVTDLINVYKEKLNKIGSRTLESNKKMVLVQETFQLFENKDVRVFNDIDATGKKPSDPKISTYLEDIYVLYNKNGVTFNFNNVSLSDIFISRNFDYFFIKVTIDINAIGTTNSGEKLNSWITQDLFVQYKFKGQEISPEPTIYEIFKSPIATDGFIKPKIVDNGSNPQPFTFGKKWENIDKSAAEKLKEDAKKWIINYYTGLNTLGSKQYDMMKKSLLTQEIIEQFESDGVIVFYDIDPSMGEKSATTDISTYLGDIVALFGKEGISFENSNPVNSELYLSRNNKFLFLISSVDRSVNGKDNSGNAINYKTKLNFIIQYNISDSIVKRRPIITTITDQELISQNFQKIAYTENPSAKNKLILEPSDEEVNAILDKTKQNEENNKKMADDYNKKIQEQQVEKEKADREKAAQELEKKKLLWEQNNIDKYFDGWDKKLLVKFYPLRLLMGSTQFSVEQGLKTTGKNISVEQTVGLYNFNPKFFSYDELENPVWVSRSPDKNSTFFGFTVRTELRFYLKPNTMYGNYISVQFYMDRMSWTPLDTTAGYSYNTPGDPALTYNGVTYSSISWSADMTHATRTHIGCIITYGIQRKIYRSKFTFEFYVGLGIRQQTITRDLSNLKVEGTIVTMDPNNTGNVFNYTTTTTSLPDYPNTYKLYNGINVKKNVKYYPEARIACKIGYRFGNKKLD